MGRRQADIEEWRKGEKEVVRLVGMYVERKVERKGETNMVGR